MYGKFVFEEYGVVPFGAGLYVRVWIPAPHGGVIRCSDACDRSFSGLFDFLDWGSH